MKLGPQIKAEREKQQLTQEELAQRLNVSRQAVSKWELGTAYPDIVRLIQISELFSISLDALIKGDDTLKQRIVIAEHPQTATNFWDFMWHTGWMIAIIAIFFTYKTVVAIWGH